MKHAICPQKHHFAHVCTACCAPFRAVDVLPGDAGIFEAASPMRGQASLWVHKQSVTDDVTDGVSLMVSRIFFNDMTQWQPVGCDSTSPGGHVSSGVVCVARCVAGVGPHMSQEENGEVEGGDPPRPTPDGVGCPWHMSLAWVRGLAEVMPRPL